MNKVMAMPEVCNNRSLVYISSNSIIVNDKMEKM
jgi:hypothetical protein